MRTVFTIPDLGEGVTETQIVRWLVAVGDSVVEDQAMVEVSTDKANVEIPAPATGIIDVIHAPEGALIAVGTAIVEITDGRADPAPTVSRKPPTATAAERADHRPAGSASVRPERGGRRRVRATPRVRRMARHAGIELEPDHARGRHQHVREADVRALSSQQMHLHPRSQGKEIPVVFFERVVFEPGRVPDESAWSEVDASSWQIWSTEQLDAAIERARDHTPLIPVPSIMHVESTWAVAAPEPAHLSRLVIGRPGIEAAVIDGRVVPAPVVYLSLSVSTDVPSAREAGTLLHGIARYFAG